MSGCGSGRDLRRLRPAEESTFRAALVLILLLLPGLAPATGAPRLPERYPQSLEEARKVRAAFEAALAARPDEEAPPRQLQEAERALASMLGDIEELYERSRSLEAQRASQSSRELRALRVLEEPGAPGPRPASASDVASIEEALGTVNAEVDSLMARRRALEDERSSGLRGERSTMEGRLEEWTRKRWLLGEEREEASDRTRTSAERAALDMQLLTAELGVEHAERWLRFHDERAAFLPQEIEVVSLELEAARTRLTRLGEEARAAAAARVAELSRLADEARRRSRLARQDAHGAGEESERLLRAWRADTADLEARTARRRVELAQLRLRRSLADVIADVRHRFEELKRRFARYRAIGAETDALVRQAFDQVAEDRRAYLLGEEVGRTRKARRELARELDQVELGYFDLTQSAASLVARARTAWHAARGIPPGADGGWQETELKRFDAALRERQRALRDLGEVLRELGDGYVTSQEQVLELGELLDLEGHWLERHSLFVRARAPSPLRALERLRQDLASWREERREARGRSFWLLLALVLSWVALVRRARRRYRDRLRGPAPSARERAQRAWLAVGLGSLWVPLPLLLAVLAPRVLAVGRGQAEAMRGVLLLAAGIFALLALTRGLLRLASDSTAARWFRRLAIAAAVLTILLGVPLAYLGQAGRTSSNPDLYVLLGRTFRTGLAVILGLGLLRRRLVASLFAAEHRTRNLGRLRLAAPMLAAVAGAVVVADWLGYARFASWFFAASLGSLLSIGLGLAAGRSALRALRVPVRTSTIGDIEEEQRAYLIGESRLLVRLAIFAATLGGLGLALGIRRTDTQALLGFSLWPLGSSTITLGHLLLTLLVVGVSVLVARVVRGFLDHFALVWVGMERSVRYSVATTVHYALLFGGLLLALAQLGVKLDEVQWLLAAAGVGIGFGLQEIVSNFVSGIIILVERPLRVGDVITVGDLSGEVVEVNIRATTIRTFQNVFMLVPNKDLITQRLVNHTGSDPRVRVDMPIGVAYGSDLKLVRDVLLEVADRHGLVLKKPPPDVYFAQHGDSSLDLELRVWVLIRDARQVPSDLRLAIDAAFRRAGIQIPFPQRDVHLYAERRADPGGGPRPG